MTTSFYRKCEATLHDFTIFGKKAAHPDPPGMRLVPFIWPENFLQCISAPVVEYIGRLHMESFFASYSEQ